jgi:ATP-dependent helicase/nuclease subunit B
LTGVTPEILRAGPLLLTPTRRLAHQLRAQFDAENDAQGLQVWRTLEVLPWQVWLTHQFTLERRSGRRTGRLLATEVAALLWRRIIQDDPGAQAAVSPTGLARAAHRSWRRMHAYRIPVAALTEEATSEARSFARWERRYSEWLAEHGAIDPDLALNELVAASVTRPLRLIGFDEFTPSQMRLLERLRAGGVDVAVEPRQARRGDVSRVNCRDARAELEAAARWAAARLDQDAHARLAIVVPALGTRRAEVRRALERVLSPASGYTGGPPPESRVFEIAEAPPLSGRTIVVAALDLLTAFGGTADFAASGRLLRNPCLRGAAAEAGARAMLDGWLRRHAAHDLPLARLLPLAAERSCPILADVVARGLEVARRHTGRAWPSAWSSRFLDLLAVLGWPGEALASTEHQIAERLRALLAGLASADEIAGQVNAAEARQLVRELAEGVPFEPEEIDTPLLVIDPEASAGMSFDGLWLTGMEAGRWPPPAMPDPFLPRSWQVRQGMPGANAELAERQSRRLFERLTRSADEVVTSVAQFDADAPVLASALLKAVPLRLQPIAWAYEPLAARIHAARPELEWLRDTRLPRPVPGRRARGGARLLELQSACPFRAGAEYRLHARALGEPGPGLSAAERGELVHRVLARLWRALGDQRTLLGLDMPGVHRQLRALIDAEVALLRNGASTLLQRLLDLESDWLALRLQELLACDRERAPFVIDSLETARTVALGAMKLEVKLDRVDRLPDGSLAIIDYKTGGDAEPGAWLGERPRLPQLPLYVLAVDARQVGAVAFGHVRARRTAYAGIARDPGVFGGIASFGGRDSPRGYASWDELLTSWRERLLALAEEYADGDARLAPDPATACRHCHLPGLCRINETALGTRGRDR